ncbi:MAG: suppressor of fused domain protein [Myxococcota bacterium]
MNTFRTEFELKGPPRTINDQNVGFLDQSLAAAAGAQLDQVLHGIDPKRILRFSHGGPPVWSVAVCPAGPEAFLWVTYGLSSLIDPDMPFQHEMSIEVRCPPGSQPPEWPMFFLRSLARYQITSGRELKVGDVMPFPCSITRAAMAPEHRGAMPDSPLTAIAVVADPKMQAVRRVVGLMNEEVEISKLWSAEGFVGATGVQTVLSRQSYLRNQSIVRACQEGSEREGSKTSAAHVEGLRWVEKPDGYYVTFPRSGRESRLVAHLRARLGFGRPILLHGSGTGPGTEVAFVQGETHRTRVLNGTLLEITAPWDLNLLCAGLTGDPILMTFSKFP